jgi:hypothetical protein
MVMTCARGKCHSYRGSKDKCNEARFCGINSYCREQVVELASKSFASTLKIQHLCKIIASFVSNDKMSVI